MKGKRTINLFMLYMSYKLIEMTQNPYMTWGSYFAKAKGMLSR